MLLETIVFPEPVIDVAIEPKTKADQDKLATALGRLSEEDPTFRVRTDEETGQTVIAGMGELHLEIIVDRLHARVQGRRERRQAAGRLPRDDPQARSRRSRASSSARPAAAASTATSVIALEPNEPGARLRVREQDRRRRRSRREYIPSVDQGIQEAMEAGVLAGYPVVDVKVELIDG